MTLTRRQFLTGAGAGAATAACLTPSPAHALTRAPKEMPEAALGMLFDSTLCIGCQACVSACRAANDVAIDHVPAPLADWNAAQTWALAEPRRPYLERHQGLSRGNATAMTSTRICVHETQLLHCGPELRIGVPGAGDDKTVTGIVAYDPMPASVAIVYGCLRRAPVRLWQCFWADQQMPNVQAHTGQGRMPAVAMFPLPVPAIRPGRCCSRSERRLAATRHANYLPAR
jgi:ferredoxin